MAARAWSRVAHKFAAFDVGRQVQAEQVFCDAYVEVYARRLAELLAEREGVEGDEDE